MINFIYSTINILKNTYSSIKIFIKIYSIKILFNKRFIYKNIHFFNNNKNIFSELCEKHGSDKGYINFSKKTPYGWKPHSYSNFYFNLFNHCKNNINLVFECGIGTNNTRINSNMSSLGRPGASLRVFRDYFKNATIYGADIDKDILFKEERILTFEVDQLNVSSIKKMWSQINKDNFDLIIDDGLHSYHAAITLFFNSFKKLRKNGIYIIEDVNNNYLELITNRLNKFYPEVIIMNNKQLNLRKNIDNNLILFRRF